MINITKDCDCMSGDQKPIMKDIGILASKDSVAIDKASLDLVEQFSGRSLISQSYPSVDPTVQLLHGDEIGLGKIEYDLVMLS